MDPTDDDPDDSGGSHHNDSNDEGDCDPDDSSTAQVARQLLDCLRRGDRPGLRARLFGGGQQGDSDALQAVLTFTLSSTGKNGNSNEDWLMAHWDEAGDGEDGEEDGDDAGEVQRAAAELLGQQSARLTVRPMNLLQLAAFLGEEELACDLLEFVRRRCGGVDGVDTDADSDDTDTSETLAQTRPKHRKSQQRLLLLWEYLGRTWGPDGNTVLHLASFHGMPALCRRLLECGANVQRRNGRGYRVGVCIVVCMCVIHAK